MFDVIERTVHVLSRLCNKVGEWCLILMMSLIIGNIILRAVYRAFGGTWEIVALLEVFVVFGVVAYTQQQKGHVSIDIITARLPQRFQRVITSITSSLCLCFCLLIAWQSLKLGTHLWRTNVTTPLMGITLAPAAYIVFLGSLLISLEFLVDLVRSFIRR